MGAHIKKDVKGQVVVIKGLNPSMWEEQKDVNYE